MRIARTVDLESTAKLPPASLWLGFPNIEEDDRDDGARRDGRAAAPAPRTLTGWLEALHRVQERRAQNERTQEAPRPAPPKATGR